MKKFFFLNDSLKKETINEIIAFLNENDGELGIFFDSPGGEQSVAMILNRIFSEQKERITLIASGDLSSAAFFVFFMFTGKREILDLTVGEWHMSRTDIEMFSNGKIKGEWNKFCRKRVKEYEEKFIKSFNKKIGLSDKEMKDFYNGEDIIFDAQRMREIITKQHDN